ncbi:MAG: hypothetical protein IKM11_03210 [Oscillospiraceae bacterium]|nr:hypothetical protein [Oscillospiraceae bacterium]
MTKTTNYKLNMPEAGDALSIAPLNENTQKIDALLHGMTKMACGSYTGSGSMSVTIATPGMKPQALLVRSCRGSEIAAQPIKLSEVLLSEVSQTASGFLMWIGQDIDINYWVTDGTIWDEEKQDYEDACYEKKGTVVFTSASGSLSWTLSANPAPTSKIDHSGLVNNGKDLTYEWIAFGTAVE